MDIEPLYIINLMIRFQRFFQTHPIEIQILRFLVTLTSLTADSVVNVYDFVLEHVPNTHLTNDWIIKLTDVWGYTVQGQFSGVNTENMEVLAPKLKIYPNPVSNFLMIDLNNKNELSIVKIYDIYGQIAIAERITKNKINVSSLNSGIYFISINGLTAGFIKY